MPGLGLPDALQGQAMVVLDYNEALINALTQHVLQGQRHGRDSLARTQHPHPAARQIPAAAVGHKPGPARPIKAQMA